MKKRRLDQHLVEQGLISTRARAQSMILAGHVLVNDQPIMKAGHPVLGDEVIRLREPEMKYVSRGAFKLLGGIEYFGIQLEGKVGMDIGSSTGGFTEVCLEKGASKMYAIDVGTNQLAWKIRQDPRVVAMENTHAKDLNEHMIPEKADFWVMDVSFISIRKLIPSILPLLKPDGFGVVLYKPQFELGPEWIEKGGLVKDTNKTQEHLQETIQWGMTFGLQAVGHIPSPIEGQTGNQEHLIFWKRIKES